MEGQSTLFEIFAGVYYSARQSEENTDSIALVKTQKVIDASEHLKIALEKEEALKKIEATLEDCT